MNRAATSPLLLSLLFGFVACSQIGYAEDPIDLPDSPSQVVQRTIPDDNHAPSREVSWKTLPKNFLVDQKGIWLGYPGGMARGKHWIPTLAIAGVTAGLIVGDKHEMPYFRTHARNWDDFNDTFDSPITTGEVVMLPVSLLAAGYIRHDDYQVNTALLSGEAYADSAVVDLVIKAITHRQRPNQVPSGAPFTNTFFSGTNSPLKGSSFPSGHSAGAFSVATVIATRYSRHKWVPVAAYAFATAISLSRITDSSHFPSDVFLGAALGYTVTKYQTLRPQ